MPKCDQYQNLDKGAKQQNMLHRVRQFLFRRNYELVSSLKLRVVEAVILIVIEQLQMISIVTRYSVNPTLLGSPEMYYIDQFSKILLLDIFQIGDSWNLIITLLLLIGQIFIILALIVPIKGEILKELTSKYLLTLMVMMLTMPSIILSINFVIQGVNIGLNIILYLVAIANNFIYVSMQLQCSFERENMNVLTKIARPTTLNVVNIFMVSTFPILNYFMFPVSFVFFCFIILIIEIYKWYYYLHKLIYFNELFMHVKGVMLTINISANICYITILILDSAIISQNILLFITTFSIFLGNFFVTYRKYLLENIIINKDLKGENEVGLYCIFYWHCLTNITQKKNELYVSSLLKNHTNECLDLTCCCKNRQYFYDTCLKAFGNPNIQLHFDKTFIRHFIRKLLCDEYKKFNKSSILALLLSNYNIEIVEMVTQTIELIKKLNKMDHKKQLNFPEQFLLYSLKMKIRNKIHSMNLTRGHIDLQKVKEFDERLVSLNEGLRRSVKIYHSFWKQLQCPKFKQATLYDTCKINLELMFSIQKTYKLLKNINTESSELRAIMLFYSKLILHDIHLLSEVKKEIKISRERNVGLSTLELNNIQLFGNNTATMISLDNNRIKWASKNAHRIFEYNKNQFHNLTVKQLMPRHFAERHDNYIERWKSTGHSIKLNKTTYLWGCTKNGTCFSLLMFVKVIPLLHEEDYAFFSCIEKLDDQSLLICSQLGKVYGAGKLFSKLTNINPRFLQDIKMNIQVFIPGTFEYFLEYFYPQNAKLKTIKRNFEARREGYFPENIDSILMQLHQQQKLFLRKHERGEQFTKEYIGFIRQQMQELTCNVKGEYISISMVLFKTSSFDRESENVIVLKLSNAKKNNIDKYYTQLEIIISKLQILCNQDNKKGITSMFKKSRSDFFKVFLNPKRMKRILQKEQEKIIKHQQEPETICRKRVNSLATYSHTVKQLALGAKIEIKNDRVRYNFFKIKKILLEQGIISLYTYNILIGKNFVNHFSSDPKIQRQDAEDLNRSLQVVEDRIISEDNSSLDHDSEGELATNKDNDNDTFNSTSSSANFISMTNHVKMFKIKLRSLNTPKLLLFLNLIVLISLTIGIVGLIYLTSSCINNLSIGVKEFQNNQQANLILDSLFLGQQNIENLNFKPNNTYYIAQKAYFINSVSNYYQKQMFLRAQYKKIDPKILGYLTLTIMDDQTLTVAEFIELIMNQIISNQFRHVMIYYVLSMQAIAFYSSSNIYFNQIASLLFNAFLIYLLGIIALFLLTLPIVHKLKSKIKEIYELFNRVSSNEKIKYYKHFTFLNNQFKKKQEIQYSELNSLIIIYETRLKYLKTNTKSVFSEDSFARNSKRQATKQRNAQGSNENEQSISTDTAIYFQITGIYLILLVSIIFNYVFVTSYHKVFMNANDQFIALFNAKTLLTSRIVQGQFELMGYPHEASYNSTNIEFVNILYSTYSIEGISQTYKDYVLNLVTGKPCNLISHLLTQNQLSFCGTLNSKTFEEGGTDNLYYSQRKMEEKVNEYYAARNYTPNNEQNITQSTYLMSQEFFEINMGYFYSTLMIYDLYEQVDREISSFASHYQVHFYVSLSIFLLLALIFVGLWLYLYFKLAEDASYINAFLLLIPFDVLSENSYIKLYIKNQFDYKSSY